MKKQTPPVPMDVRLMNITATVLPISAAIISVFLSVSKNSARLGRPVSGS